jgi:hypothetical protein
MKTYAIAAILLLLSTGAEAKPDLRQKVLKGLFNVAKEVVAPADADVSEDDCAHATWAKASAIPPEGYVVGISNTHDALEVQAALDDATNNARSQALAYFEGVTMQVSSEQHDRSGGQGVVKSRHEIARDGQAAIEGEIRGTLPVAHCTVTGKTTDPYLAETAWLRVKVLLKVPTLPTAPSPEALPVEPRPTEGDPRLLPVGSLPIVP